ncbi:hypothetical protein M9Y10_034499 [Tritrichomonas musculus]|uniref:Uncharacterized protein n=1 Tax=Tritrichomonas musculus TaxID=1915356 RepID=A0ABR2KIA2_9EUKA
MINNFSRLENALAQIKKVTENSGNSNQEIISHLSRLLQRLEMKNEELIKQTESERNKLTDRMSNFDFANSPAWMMIKKKGWDNLNHKELLSIASVIANKCNITLDREAKRRKPILVKWFDENLSAILPAVDFIQLEFHDETT